MTIYNGGFDSDAASEAEVTRIAGRRCALRAAVAVAAVAAVCLGGFPSASFAQKTLNVGVAVFTDTLSPGGGGFNNLSLVFLTTDPLIRRNADDTLGPGLAQRWEKLEPTRWRFHLRKGVKFHDGVEFTAADVKYTIGYVLDLKTVYVRKRRISEIIRVDIIDPYTLDIITKAPFPTLLRGLSEIPMEPKQYHEKVGIEGYAKHPIGTGPFRYGKWTAGDRYELTANKDYWDGAPKVDSLLVRQISEGATRVASLIAGETHIIEEVPVDLIPSIERRKELEISSVPSSVSLVITLDTTTAPFNDPRVREAMDLAIDKEAINKQLLGGRGEVLQGQLVTRSTLGFNPKLKARAVDILRARKLLADAGYPNGFSTSIITMSGRYLSDTDICNAVSGMLQKIGVKAAVNLVEGAVWTTMDRAKQLTPSYMVGWFSVGDADFNTVWYTQAAGRSYWKNEEYEKLFLAARSTVDEAERIKHYNRMMEIMHQENPSLFLVGLPRLYGKSKAVSNWLPSSDSLLRLSKVELR